MLTDLPADGHYLLATTLTALLLLLSWPVYNLFFHPLAAVPGPRLWAVTSYFYMRSMTGGQYAQKSLDLHSKYGPVVRIAPNEVSSIADETWSAYKSGTCFPKSPYWFQARPNGAFGILASPPSEHGRFRRTFAQAFTDKELSDHESLIDRHVADLVQKVAELGKNGSEVNITDELEFASFDIAGDFAYSRSFKCLHKPDNRGSIRFIQLGMKLFTLRAMKRVMGIERLSNLIDNAATSVQPRKTPYHQSLAIWTKDRLNSTQQKDKPDLMDFVANSTGERKTLKPNEAENAIGDFMIAGTETVSTSVVAALLNLTSNPEILNQLYDELAAGSDGLAPLDHGRLAQSPLLNAVVDESMRLAPSIPHALPRIVPTPGTRVSGYFLSPEAQTCLSFNQYAAYRSPVNFCQPTKFIPKRWIDPEGFQPHNSAIFQPFSVGPRNCIGKQWGLRVVRALLSQLVIHFEIKRAGAEWAWEDQNTSFVWEKKDLNLNLKPRRA